MRLHAPARAMALAACFAVAPLAAQATDLAAAADALARQWLAPLSLEQRAGQLFVAWTLSRADGPAHANNHTRLLQQVQSAGLGGVIVSLGTTAEAAALVDRLQAAAPVPLLVAGDFEGGVWWRLRGATELGNQMLVGASRSPRLAFAMGQATAKEALALGCPWVLAPVLDVNDNPQNPVIHVRSFGAEPDLVGKLGAAFTQGVASGGALACGKHFPGHGNVDTDSHLALPTVPGTAARLRAVELPPFAAAIRAGLPSVMTGHLAVPGFGEAADLPATWSQHILGTILRAELGFQGLLVTDALDMGALVERAPAGEAAVRALAAGADVLLMPPDLSAARDAVVAAVRSGRVPAARLDEAVHRILLAKARLGLLSGRGLPDPQWQQQMAQPAARATAAEIAQRGLTLVRARGAALPLQPAAGTLIVSLDDGDASDPAPGALLLTELGTVLQAATARLSANSPAAAIQLVARRVATANRVLFLLHHQVRSWDGVRSLPPALRPIWAALRPAQTTVAVSFGNPYLPAELPAIGTWINAYIATAPVQRAVANALTGAAPLTGRSPVTVPDTIAAGHGLSWYPGQGLAHATLAEQDLDPALATALQTVLDQGLREGVFSAAQCLVARRGACVLDLAVGQVHRGADAAQVRPDTVFDLASLTKVMATMPAVLLLVARGVLQLSDPVVRWLPGFAGDAARNQVTIQHLLQHQSGLPAYAQYYKQATDREAVLALALREPLVAAPGERTLYSDVGYILLGAIVEAASGERLDAFVAREVFRPLQLRSAGYAPRLSPALAHAVATEIDPRRGGLLQGVVHDENAWAMGGVAGHAGLFANGRDVLAFGVCLLGGGRGLWPRELVALAIGSDGCSGERQRGLGFAPPPANGFFAAGGSPVCFAHTGFTGTSLYCDPQEDLCLVLLTNRVHPTRDNDRLVGVRQAVHGELRRALR